MQAWLPVIGSAVLNFVLLAYFYGKFKGEVTEKFKAQDKINDSRRDTDEALWDRVNDHETRISRIEGRHA